MTTKASVRGPRTVLDVLNQEPAHVTWAREQRGVTKRELGVAAGIAESMVGEIERGTRNATPRVLAAFAAYLGCPVSMLERRVKQPQSKAKAA
jgi:transcriptional regulator with XRE-family HTH domain